MKNLILIILLLCISFHAKAQWYYGAGEATNLENQIGFDKHQQKIVTGQSDNPGVVAKYGSAGSIYLKTDGTLWTKKDAGTSTNWNKFVDTAAQIAALLPYATNASTTASLSLKVDLATTASVGSVLTSNGSSWVAGNPVPVGVGNGVAFYLDDTASDIATYFSLLRNPSNVAEILDTVAVTSGTSPVAIENYASASSGLGDSSIDSGVWIFSTYGSVSAVGGPICTIRASVYKRTSGGVETLLFTAPDTPTLTTTVTLYEIETVQPSFAINSTDRLIVKYFATNTSGTSRNVTLYHNGTTHYSHVHTPITQRHNDLAGLQGGSAGEYNHLTNAQATIATTSATTTQSGYVSTALQSFGGVKQFENGLRSDTVGAVNTSINFTKNDLTTSVMKLDTANSRLGVNGITSPTVPLEISKTAAGTTLLRGYDSALNHQMTTILPTTNFLDISETTAGSGGTAILGISSNNNSTTPLLLKATHGAASPTAPMFQITTAKRNSTGIQSNAATETLTALENNGTRLQSVMGDGELRLGSATQWTGVKHSGTATVTYTLPNVAPTLTNQFLGSDTLGVTSWKSPVDGINRDNLMVDGGFESGISEIVCSSGVCTNDNTAAIGSKSLKIATTSTTASVTWSKVNAALANRDLGIDLELSSTNATMQLCGQVLGVTQNCVPMAIVGSYGRLSTYVTADASGNFGWVVQSSTATSTTITNVDNVHVSTNPFTYKNLTDYQTIRLVTANGYGSSATKIRRFSTTEYSYGSGLFSYIDDATNGGSFTMVKDAYCNVVYVDSFTGTNTFTGISKNSNQLTTSMPAITEETRLMSGVANTANYAYPFPWSGKLLKGDVIRGHSEGVSTGTQVAKWIMSCQAESENIVTPAKNSATDSAAFVVTAANSQGLGTIGASEVQWHQEGQFLVMEGKITAGTTTAAEMRVNLPIVNGAQLVSAGTSAIPSIRESGKWFFGGSATAHGGAVLIEPGVSYLTFGDANTFGSTSINSLSKTTGSASIGTGGTFSFSAKVPIAGWTSNATFLAAVPTVKTCRMTETLAYNVACGSASADTTITRNLTATDSASDCSFLTLSANAFKPIAGTYCIDAGTNAYLTNRTMAMIYDGSSVVATGRTTHAYASSTASATPQVKYCFSTDGTKSYSLQQYTTTASSSNGLGVESGKSGISTVCSEVIVTKYK